MLDLALAIGHHLLVFALFGTLAVEIALVRRGMSIGVVRGIARVDNWYGALAGAIVLVGLSRAIFAAKGWAYYSHNGFFWAKMAIFVLVAILSIPPTLQYIRWNRAADAPDEAGVRRVQAFLYLELALFAPLLACAAAMARGWGEF